MGKRRCGFGVVEAEGQSEVMRERNQTAENPAARVRGQMSQSMPVGIPGKTAGREPRRKPIITG